MIADNLPFDVKSFEYLADAVVIVNDKSNVVYLNMSAVKLYATSGEEALGKPLSGLFVEEWLSPKDKEASASSLNQKGFWSGENYHVNTRSGSKFFASSSVNNFIDSSGRKSTIFVVHQSDGLKKAMDCIVDEEHFVQRFDSALSTELYLDKQELANIIDVQSLQSMIDDIYAVTKIGFALIDLKGNVLAAAGWQDICTKFHRVNPQTLWNCLESDLVLTQGVAQGEFRTYKCKNNMWDIVTPLIIGKKHVGNIFSGQFFFDDESVDRDLFAKQAERFGFDKDAYLAALDRVPRWNRGVVQSLVQFYVKLSEMISKLSYGNLRLSKALSDQKLVEIKLRESQHDLKHAQSVAKAGSWRLNANTNELLWSEETYQIFGIPLGTHLTYEAFLEMIHPEDRELVDNSWKAALRGEPYDIEHRIVAKGNVVWVREKAELEFDKEGSLVGGFGTVQDITEHKMDEQKLQRLNRSLRAISNSNQALMRATDEVAFLQQGCRIIVEDCGYALVWIGFAEDNEEKTVKPMTYAGFDKGYIDSLKVTWSDTERGKGPTGRAIRTGKVQICNDISSDLNFGPWRKQALERGYVASIVLPLISEGKAFGAINIYSQEPNPFSEEEVKLLTELASDFSHGLMLLRMRAAKEQAEKALLETSEQCLLALEASNIGTWDYNITTGEVFWDERTRNMFGVSTSGAIKYDDAIERIHPDDQSAADEVIKDAIAGVNDGKFDHEFRVVWPDGTTHWIASHGKVHFEGKGNNRKAVRFICVNMEVTKRKLDEKALLDARIEWERTFDSLPDYIAIIDNKHRILRVNKAMAKKLGVKPELCFGMCCYSCVHGAEQVPDFCPHAKTLQDGKVHVAKVFEEALGGDLIVTTTPLKDENGKILGTIHIARPINKAE